MSVIEMVELATVQTLPVMKSASLIDLVAGHQPAPTTSYGMWALGDRPLPLSIL